MKKHVFFIMFVFFAIAGVFVSCSGNSNADGGTGRAVNVTGVSLNKVALDLGLGKQETLVATIIPSNATNQRVTWSSDDTSVATVTNGRVTGVGEGTARITVTTEHGGFTDHCDVFVENIAVSGVTLNKTSTSILEGSTETLTATIVPANATNKAVSWASSNTNVATVNADGFVTGVAAGSATITVVTQNGNHQASCAVTVNLVVPVTGITLNKTSTSILEGSTETLTATIVPANATNKAVSWASNNINVATVNADGLVTGVAAGSATITVVTQDGNHQASCVVTVDTVSIPVTGLTLNKNSAILTVGGADILIATLQPSNATNKTITWTTSDSGVATVNNGSVTAYGTGTAIITATAQGSGQKAYCDVTVRPTPGYVPKIYAAGNFGLAEHDETFQNNRITMNDELYSVFATGNGNVYTAGWSDGAAYWRNSVRYYLNATGDSEAYSIFVANGNEYVAGEQSYGSTYEASLWKNGQVRPLNVNTGYGSWANSVFVYDDVEYVAGVQRAGSDVMYPTLWVNGQAQHYGPGVSTDANAYSVYVRGNIPYVAGWIGDDGYYWVDGVAHRLQRSRSWVEAYSIFVADNGDVYVAGCEDWLPTVWRNGNLLYRLSFDYSFANYTQGYATSIFVYNGDVYVAGSCYDYDFDVYDAYIWKNGDWFSYWYDDYANENKMFYSIFVK